MAIDREARTSRRGILAAALGGAGVLAAAKLGRPEAAQAADGGNAILGQANTSTTETSFQNTDSAEASVRAIHTDGIGFQASTTTGTGLRADATDATPSTFVAGSYRSGVVATVGDLGIPDETDGIASSSDESAVYGFSNVSEVSNGVWGDSWNGTGVYGTGAWGVFGIGYDGVTGIGSHYGLYGEASTPTGFALYTSGKIKFAGRSGRSTIASGTYYKDIAITGMTTSSAVIVTLQTYKSGFAIAAAVSYTGKFRVYLNKTATSSMAFGYVVIG